MSMATELREALAQDRDAASTRVREATSLSLFESGRGLDFTEADLSGLDLSGLDFRYATFNRAQLHGTKFDGADLTGATLICPGMERASFRNAKLTGAYVHALAAQVCNFDGADLDILLDGTGALFHGCSMRRTTFTGARLAGVTLYQCDLSGSSWKAASLQGAVINECRVQSGVFDGADVAQLTVTKCCLRNASFAEAAGVGMIIQRPTAVDGLRLTGAKLPLLRLHGLRGTVHADGLAADGLDLYDCHLSGSFAAAALNYGRLLQSQFVDVSFLNAKLAGVSIRECAFRECDLAGVQAENASVVESHITDGSMVGFSARAAVFRDCDLTGANLRGAYLYRAMLTGDPPGAMALTDAVLEGANLVQAYIAADLRRAKLRGAKLAYARLNQSNFSGADLRGVGLYEASLVKADFTNAQLAGVAPPFFADRCPGLLEALTAGNATEAVECVHRAKAVTAIGAKGST